MAFATIAMIGAGVAAASGIAQLGMSLAGRGDRIREQQQAKEEIQQRKGEYESLDTSNIYANVKNQYTNLENTFDDLTVNQQQAQFEKQMFQQQQANIMQGLQGAAGGSGIAALAQTLANQGQIASQRASASIGAQESKINMMRAQEASRLQQMERAGETQAEGMRLAGASQARGLDWQKTGTLLGMSQQRLGAANQARAEAKAQQMGAIGDIGSVGLQMATGGMNLMSPKTTPTSGVDPSTLQAPYVKTYKMDPNQLKDRPLVTNQDLYGISQDEINIKSKNPFEY